MQHPTFMKSSNTALRTPMYLFFNVCGFDADGNYKYTITILKLTLILKNITCFEYVHLKSSEKRMHIDIPSAH